MAASAVRACLVEIMLAINTGQELPAARTLMASTYELIPVRVSRA